jgi:hypothetical protein
VAPLHQRLIRKEMPMPILVAPPGGMQMLREMTELAQLPAAAQRYIRRSLDVAFGRWERLSEIARDEEEARSIDRQAALYRRLDKTRAANSAGNDAEQAVRFVHMAAELGAFDLGQHKIRSFAAFRFLYERLLGAPARPWLLSVFVMAVTMAPLAPAARAELLSSIDEQWAAARHSSLEPRFLPEWVDRLDG